MDTTARRCVFWTIACFVIGTAFMVWLPDVLYWLATDLMRNENAIYALTEIILSVVRWTAFPLGGALVASAIIISWLRHHLPALTSTTALDQKS